MQVNLLLQVALENAMLKRDLPGLRDIVTRLGKQPGIEQVMIINPSKEVRFASNKKMLGRQFTLADLGCVDCQEGDARKLSHTAQFTMNENSVEVLRSVNPIRNKRQCIGCHGEISKNPVNGTLIVDHKASGIRKTAIMGAVLLSGAGILVMFLALLGTWVYLRRSIITPVAALHETSHALASGKLNARAVLTENGKDEITELCKSFNSMAGKLEQSLADVHQKEAFLQNLIDTMPDGIRVINENYQIVMVNQAYCTQMKAPSQSLVGTPCFFSHRRDEPCQPSLITCPFQALEKPNQPMKYMHRHVRQDGTSYYTEITAAQLITNQNGKQSKLIVEACRDLEQQVRYSQEQRLAELGQLATGVAHEIHNPLASVRIGLQSILKRVKKGQPIYEELVEYLTSLDGEVDKCVEVTKRLLNLSLPPGESIELVSFSTVIPEIVSLLRYEASKAKVMVDINLGHEDLRVLARDSEMRMLILNLVQNAFHAMLSGGKLIIRGRVLKNKVQIELEDTGVGINPKYIPYIFDPFFSKRADGVEGTGLGLTISKAIVNRYNGTLEVISEPGVGTKFTIMMPLADHKLAQYE